MEKLTPFETYQILYQIEKDLQLNQGLSEDKANRRANIYAVKNTWRAYNSQVRPVAYISSMEFY